MDLVLKFGVGGGGISWEIALDHVRNPLVLLVCGMLASSTNAAAFLRRIVAAAKADEEEFKRLLEEEEQLHDQESR